MSDRPVIRLPVANVYANTLASVQAQLRHLGESILEPEFRSYIEGPGPAAGYAPDLRSAFNPHRPKSWHLGRVKHFCHCFMNGTPVDPIEVAQLPGFGWVVSDGEHRVLGAHFANQQEVDAFILQRTRRGPVF